MRLSTAIAVLLIASVCLASDSPTEPPKILGHVSGDYLGQTPPGLKPVIFAPDVISTGEHQERDVTFSPGLKEFYFTRDATIMMMKQTDEGWTAPVAACFASGHEEFEGYVSPDGQSLYYISRRPMPGDTVPTFYQIWYVQRDGDTWGIPKMLNDQRDFYPTMTTDGYMYFTDVNTDLFRTKMVDGLMSTREKLSDSVNTAAAEYNACVSPDESFIIFTSFGWGDGFGGGDLFISYRKDDGTWTTAKNMGGGINSNGHDYCPSITADARYLFFASNKAGTEDLYWVDAGIIDSLRTKDLNTADMLFDEIMADGPEAARSAYEELRPEYAEYCLFDGRLLTGIGDRLLGENKTLEAVAVMKLGAELHPETLTYIQKLKLAVVDGDDELFDAVNRELEEKKATLVRANEAQLNRLGYQLMGWEKLVEAIKIFRLNVELFPGSFNVYDSYAEALLNHGDTLASMENYERSLELNQENTNAEEILETLRGE